MPGKSNRNIVPQDKSFFQGLTLRIKLLMRLMGDARVSPLLKILPIGSLVYLVLPLDIPGPFDDAAIIWLATYMFVELCPPHVVQEHLDALNATRKVMDNYEETAHPDAQGEVIDGEIVDNETEEK